MKECSTHGGKCKQCPDSKGNGEWKFQSSFFFFFQSSFDLNELLRKSVAESQPRLLGVSVVFLESNSWAGEGAGKLFSTGDFIATCWCVSHAKCMFTPLKSPKGFGYSCPLKEELGWDPVSMMKLSDCRESGTRVGVKVRQTWACIPILPFTSYADWAIHVNFSNPQFPYL